MTSPCASRRSVAKAGREINIAKADLPEYVTYGCRLWSSLHSKLDVRLHDRDFGNSVDSLCERASRAANALGWRYLVGRDAGDIVLGDPDVSASHARLEVRQGQVLVTDLGSTNGTIGHDQQRVRPGQALGFGQTIRMGRSGITVVTGAEAGGTRAMVQVPNMTALPAPRAVPAPSAPGTGAPPSELQVRGNRILCRAGRATKVSLSGYAATHVSGGGSTTTHGPGGYIHTNNSVSSYTTHHTVQELWLRTDESEDLRFQLRDSNVDVLVIVSVMDAVEKRRCEDGD
ncbi:MAG TPA: FHA domain-containing protein [Polyangiaceae bacterium]|nr:FHA domain-containing protein [Polyangiaceae bacterium]